MSDIGWQNWKNENQIAGTTGQAKQVEALKIKLTGAMAQKYDIYYRTHVADYGWLDWAKNGEMSGTSGMAKRVECVQVVLVQKGGIAPGNTDRANIVK